jgi:hypothetical protein
METAPIKTIKAAKTLIVFVTIFISQISYERAAVRQCWRQRILMQTVPIDADSSAPCEQHRQAAKPSSVCWLSLGRTLLSWSPLRFECCAMCSHHAWQRRYGPLKLAIAKLGVR